MEMEHLIANASWLAGSTVTIILDIIVLGQFIYYRRKGGKGVRREEWTG